MLKWWCISSEGFLVSHLIFVDPFCRNAVVFLTSVNTLVDGSVGVCNTFEEHSIAFSP